MRAGQQDGGCQPAAVCSVSTASLVLRKHLLHYPWLQPCSAQQASRHLSPHGHMGGHTRVCIRGVSLQLLLAPAFLILAPAATCHKVLGHERLFYAGLVRAEGPHGQRGQQLRQPLLRHPGGLSAACRARGRARWNRVKLVGAQRSLPGTPYSCCIVPDMQLRSGCWPPFPRRSAAQDAGSHPSLVTAISPAVGAPAVHSCTGVVLKGMGPYWCLTCCMPLHRSRTGRAGPLL
jgi:hypothetical protein